VKAFGGRVLFLDRDDINTDEIIPARYLTVSSKKALAPHCLEDLGLEGFDPARDIEGAGAIVTRANFGCGSSREHAPWALESRGINLVIASGFARIYRQNMFNCGLIAARLPKDAIDDLFRRFAASGAKVALDWESRELIFGGAGTAGGGSGGSVGSGGSGEVRFALELGGFDRELVEAGGWVDYANAKY
jgi:3-isopropylmalate/(R)-2-methylmalate dehydratase small subunit